MPVSANTTGMTREQVLAFMGFADKTNKYAQATSVVAVLSNQLTKARNACNNARDEYMVAKKELEEVLGRKLTKAELSGEVMISVEQRD